MYICSMIVCMCADCMNEKTKKYTLLNPYAGSGCFGVFFVYRPLDFLALV